MKKPYEKPQLIALSLKANDALCACQIDAEGPNMDPVIRRIYLETPNAFTEDMNCGFIVEGYCKMASASILFNS